MKRLIQKALSELTLSKTPVGKNDVSVRKVFSFLLKKKAYERIGRMLFKALRYTVRKSLGINLFDNDGYKNWIRFNAPTPTDLIEYKKLIPGFNYKPLISIILPVYNSNLKFLMLCCDSVFNQIYENWELCISDDHSTKPEIIEFLKDLQNKNNKIKLNLRTTNGHISKNTNDAIELAKGEYIALLDHDDLLAPEALYEIVKLLNNDKTIDFIYSDEDKIDSKGNIGHPYFKPDFCPESLLSRNYITHLSILRKSIVKEIGGMRIGFEGSQDYDLFLRFAEKSNNIKHIPKILYHWRMHVESTSQNESAKPYAYNAGEKALSEALERRKTPGQVKLIEGFPGIYNVRPYLKVNEKISIIIPSKNQAGVLKTCIESILNVSTYTNYEIIIVDNDSSEESFFELIKYYEAKLGNIFQCIRLSIDFNFSILVNTGVTRSTGNYIILLNNDMEVISPDWMEGMLSFAQLEEIGAVGAKLLYPNRTIQHAGTVIGLGGVAGHTFIGLDEKADGYYYALKCINNYSAVTAACLMINKSKYNQVNGFNEELPIEFNDVDFCLQLIEAGYRNVCLPDVVLFHYESLSRGDPHATSETHKQHIRDVEYFRKRWQKYIDHDPCYNPNLTLNNTHFEIRH